MTWHNELIEDAMMEEYHNDVWDIVLKLEIKSVVSPKWICKIKYVVDGSKESFVAKGFSQREGIDYEETLAPGSKNYHGTCFHDEVGSTPDVCKYKLT